MHTRREVRPGLRRGRRPDRQGDRPRRSRRPSAPRTWSAWTRWRTSSRRCRTTCRTIPWHALLQGARRGWQALIEQGRARPEDRRRLLQEGRQGHPASSTRRSAIRRRRRRRPTTKSAAMLKKPTGREVASCCATRTIRRRSSCGRSSATSSTTSPSTWPTSPRPRATSTSRCAGASAGAQGPFELWQAAGWQQVAQWVAGRHRRRQGDGEGAAARRGCSTGASGVHARRGLVSARRRTPSCRAPALPVYERQLFPEPLLGETLRDRRRPSSRTTACACGIDGDDVLIVVVQDQDAHDQRRGARWPAARRSTIAERNFKAW